MLQFFSLHQSLVTVTSEKQYQKLPVKSSEYSLFGKNIETYLLQCHTFHNLFQFLIFLWPSSTLSCRISAKQRPRSYKFLGVSASLPWQPSGTVKFGTRTFFPCLIHVILYMCLNPFAFCIFYFLLVIKTSLCRYINMRA